MSDLIDLDTSSDNLPQPRLAAPLLPCPSDNNDAPRSSLGPDDNPFDLVTREVNRYIRRSMDPFEMPQQRPPNPGISHPFVLPTQPQLKKHLLSNPLTTTQQSDPKCSLLNDCNPTNSLNFQNPDVAITVDPPTPDELSILNETMMNDALLEEELDPKISPFVNDSLKSCPSGTKGSGSFLTGMSNGSNTYSSCSSNSSVLNRAFVSSNLASCNGVLNASSTGVNSNGISDIIRRYKEIRTNEGKAQVDRLVNFGHSKRNTSFIAGNFGDGLINKCIEDTNIEFILDEAKSVLCAINSAPESQPGVTDLISSFTQPDFDMLPPSDDEEDLIHLSPSPLESHKVLEQVTKPPSPPKDEEKSIIREVETDLFGLSNPKTKLYALTRIVELKNIVKVNKPEVAKLLDDLENALELNCNDNTELLTTCLQSSNEHTKLADSRQSSVEDNVKEGETNRSEEDLKNNLSCEKDINKSDKIVDLGIKKVQSAASQEEKSQVSSGVTNIFSNLERLFSELPIDSPTRDLLKNLSAILSKLPGGVKDDEQSSLENSKVRPKVRRSKSSVSSRRALTSNENAVVQKGIPCSTNILQRSNSVLSFGQDQRTSSIWSRSHSNLSSRNRVFSESNFDKLKKESVVPLKTVNKLKSDVREKQGLVPEIAIPETKLVTNIKNKLKRKNDAEPITKKGPMKAVIPVNNMQKTSILKKALSPKKSTSNLLNVSSATNPLATSTPVVRRSISQMKPRILNGSPTGLRHKDSTSKLKMSPRRSGLYKLSPMNNSLSPKRDTSSKHSKSMLPRPMLVSPLRPNNQNVIKTFHLVPKTTNAGISEKENQY